MVLVAAGVRRRHDRPIGRYRWPALAAGA